eukprot:m.15540 g.15540  ORF g.15540 m.15540 type:complete len:552 (+) comp3281_c0_seq1:241-1896(+)
MSHSSQNDLVSIIVPCYNCAAYLPDALQSVMLQSYRPLQLSVVDDCSTDTSVAVVTEWIPRLEAAGISVVLSTRNSRDTHHTGHDGTCNGTKSPSTATQHTTYSVNPETFSHPTTPSTTTQHTHHAHQATRLDMSPSRTDPESPNTATQHHAHQETPRHHPSPSHSEPRGPGPTRNAAVRQSTGQWLCFLDADDTMVPTRVAVQLDAARQHPDAIVGSGFTRLPSGSTPRYTAWCNGLSTTQLLTHRFRELTVVQPTWFMARHVFDRVGGYVSTQAEDLCFFYQHIALWLAASRTLHVSTDGPACPQTLSAPSACASIRGSVGCEDTGRDAADTEQNSGVELRKAVPLPQANAATERDVDNQPVSHLADDARLSLKKHSQQAPSGPTTASDADGSVSVSVPLIRLPQRLVMYRYRGSDSVSTNTSRELIRRLRIEALQDQVLNHGIWLDGFAIWGAGKYGKAFYRGLNEACQRRVRAFYDVDPSKLGVYNDHGPNRKALVRTIPVLGVDKVKPPFISCVSLDRTDGAFEQNLADTIERLVLVEGTDYYLFG